MRFPEGVKVALIVFPKLESSKVVTVLRSDMCGLGVPMSRLVEPARAGVPRQQSSLLAVCKRGHMSRLVGVSECVR